MFFFWILLCIAAFLGTIALIFYLAISLNELEKMSDEMMTSVRKRYGTTDK